MFKSKEEFKEQYIRRLVESFGCAVEDTHPTEKYMVLGKMVRDYANVNWKDTKAAIKHTQAKQIYYFSINFDKSLFSTVFPLLILISEGTSLTLNSLHILFVAPLFLQ